MATWADDAEAAIPAARRPILSRCNKPGPHLAWKLHVGSKKDAALAQHARSSSRRAGIVARGRCGYELGIERLRLLQMVATGGGVMEVESVLAEEYTEGS